MLGKRSQAAIIKTYLRVSSLSQYWSKAVVCVSTPRNVPAKWVLPSLDIYVYLQVSLSMASVLSKNVPNKSCLVYVKSEKHAFLVTLRPFGSLRRGEAELCTLRC